MADFIKLVAADERVLFVNRSLITDFSYVPQKDVTTVSLPGPQDNFFELLGDQTEQIMHGEAVGG